MCKSTMSQAPPADVPLHQFFNDAAFMRLVIESLPHPFYVINVKDYTIALANKAARLGCLTPASTCYSLTHHSDRPCVDAGHPCPLAAVRQTRKSIVVEHLHYNQKGEARSMEVHAFPIFDADGELAQLIEYSLDITERRQLEREREQLVQELQEALGNVRKLSGLLPICASCKKIRDDKGYWKQIEVYIREHSEADFSHSICPECRVRLYGEFDPSKP